jgi:hypothetical protein
MTTGETALKYTLITKLGKIYTFSILDLAEKYQQAYGGVVITQQILLDTTSVNPV